MSAETINLTPSSLTEWQEYLTPFSASSMSNQSAIHGAVLNVFELLNSLPDAEIVANVRACRKDLKPEAN